MKNINQFKELSKEERLIYAKASCRLYCHTLTAAVIENYSIDFEAELLKQWIKITKNMMIMRGMNTSLYIILNL